MPLDLHDIWFLLRQGAEPDLTLVERKLALYDREWEREALEETVENLRAESEWDLRSLLPRFVPYEVARERVKNPAASCGVLPKEKAWCRINDCAHLLAIHPHSKLWGSWLFPVKALLE